jgi:hypothetical protein
MESIREVAGLVAHRGRAAGTDAERRAAVYLRDRLEDLGRPAELHTVDVFPRFGLTHALHAVLAILGSVLAIATAPIGAAIVLFALLSTFLDVTRATHLVRRTTGRRLSQNVESRVEQGKPGTLVLVAHYDAPREAPSFALATRLLRDPWLVMVVAMVLVLICAGLRVAGLEGSALTGVQFVPTVLLILMVPALADVELSGTGAGTTDNAAGVAVVLQLADELGERLDHFDVWVVLTGAQGPFALGMRAWLRLRRANLERESTVVLNVDGVADGPVTFSRREGPVLALPTHRQLRRICEEIAADGGHEARSRVIHEAGDAGAALARGLPAVTVSSPGTMLDPASLDLVFEFCRELAERVDAEVGPGLATMPRRAARPAVTQE